MLVEIVRHEPGVLHRHAEAQPLHRVHVGDVAIQGLQNVAGPALRHRAVQGIQVGQVVFVVAAPNPAQLIQIDGIRHAKILEGAEQLAVDGLRQSNLRGDTPAKVVQHTFAVHALRGGGQAQQKLGPEMVQQPLVGGRGGMVKLVHHNVIVIIRRQTVVQFLRVHRLDGDEQMVQALRAAAAHKQFAEVRVPQDVLEGILALPENFLPVGHKEQAVGAAGVLLAKTPVVKG